MNRFTYVILILIFTSGFHNLYGQKQGQAKIDSMLSELPKQREDTNKVKLLSNLSKSYSSSKPDIGLKYGQEALDLATKLDWKLGIARANYTIGINFYAKSDYPKTSEYFLKQLKLYEEIGEKNGVADVSGNIGGLYATQGNLVKALEYCLKALKMDEEIGNKKGILNLIGNIGVIYNKQGDYSKALEYSFKAVRIYEETGDKKGSSGVLGTIGATYQKQANYPIALEYYFKALKMEEETGDKFGAAGNLGNIGIVFKEQGDYPKALEYYLMALKLNEEIGNKRGIAGDMGSIGNIFLVQKAFPKALEYYFNALKMDLEIGVKGDAANAMGCIGNAYLGQKDYSKALEYYFKALKTDEEIGAKEGFASETVDIANLYLWLILDTTAIFSSNGKFQKVDSSNDSIPKNEIECLKKVFYYLNMSMALCKQNYFPSVLQNCYQNLAVAYRLNNKYDSALFFYEEYTKIKDSAFNKEKEKKIGHLEAKAEFDHQQDSLKLENEKRELALQKEIELKALKYEYEKKQAAAKSEKEKQQLQYEEELKRKQINFDFDKKRQAIEDEQKRTALIEKAKQQKKDAEAAQKLQRQQYFTFSGIAGILLLGGFSFFIVKERGKSETQRKIAVVERKKSDELLLNILPSEVAEELKAKGSAEAKMIDEVTVLFTDFKGFTQLSEKLSPKALVAEINSCFSAFDLIMEKYGVEKIKTIGDSYMAAGGLPTTNQTHPWDVVNAAVEIQQYMLDHKARKEAAGELFFEIRIGVHTGPVVAGIVGVKKFQYDIWGDTVNTASRMESSGEAGKVNISGTTYELVKDRFRCEYRGKVNAKGKGEVDMYFVG